MSNLAGLSLSLPIGSTFDLSVPRRPGLVGDLVADTKTDDQAFPPLGGMPCAAEANNQALTLSEVAKIVPLLKFSASVPNLGGALSINGMIAVGANPSLGMLSAARTGGGASAGDFTITWPANMLPASSPLSAEGTINGSTPGMIAVSGGPSGGVRVVTLNASGAAADLPFTVTIT